MSAATLVLTDQANTQKSGTTVYLKLAEAFNDLDQDQLDSFIRNWRSKSSSPAFLLLFGLKLKTKTENFCTFFLHWTTRKASVSFILKLGFDGERVVNRDRRIACKLWTASKRVQEKKKNTTERRHLWMRLTSCTEWKTRESERRNARYSPL